MCSVAKVGVSSKPVGFLSRVKGLVTIDLEVTCQQAIIIRIKTIAASFSQAQIVSNTLALQTLHSETSILYWAHFQEPAVIRPSSHDIIQFTGHPSLKNSSEDIPRKFVP